MKKLTCILLIIFLQFCIISCSKQSINNNNDEKIFENYNNVSNYDSESNSNENKQLNKNDTKEFYAYNGYVSFSISNDFAVEYEDKNIIFFEDGSAMAKYESIISIKLVDKNFYKNSNGIYINPKTNTLLTELSVDKNNKINIQNIDLQNFKIVNAMQITGVFESYSNIGVVSYFPYNQENEINNYIDFQYDENNINNYFSFNKGVTYYCFLKNIYEINNLKLNDFNNNIEFKFNITKLQNNVNNIEISFDYPLSDDKYAVFTIIKSESNIYYYLPMNIDENENYVLNNFENENLINFILNFKYN